jgi:hypothetical protein
MIIDDLLDDNLSRLSKMPKAERPEYVKMLKESYVTSLTKLVNTGYTSSDEIVA